MCEANGTSDKVLPKSEEGQCLVREDGEGGSYLGTGHSRVGKAIVNSDDLSVGPQAESSYLEMRWLGASEQGKTQDESEG